MIALLLVPATAGAVGWVAGPPLSGPGVLSVSPVATITPSGERIVAWQQRKANDRFNSDTILIRTAPAGSDFGPAQKLAIDFADGVSLTSGADGTVALVWESGTTLHIARRAPGETTFTEVQPLAVDRVNSPPAVAVSGGDIDVAFDNEDSSTTVETTAIRAARLAAGSSAITPIPGSAMAALDAVSFNQNTQPSHECWRRRSRRRRRDGFVAWEDLADSATDNRRRHDDPPRDARARRRRVRRADPGRHDDHAGSSVPRTRAPGSPPAAAGSSSPGPARRRPGRLRGHRCRLDDPDLHRRSSRSAPVGLSDAGDLSLAGEAFLDNGVRATRLATVMRARRPADRPDAPDAGQHQPPA